MTTDNANALGKLERVSLRTIWENEAANFTPWLARGENIQLLGETIGMELEVKGQEQQVGPFRADILCQNASTDGEEYILIENQLERTDHTHLGQLMTYAAGLDAVTIVWIAERFTDEHRAALDWLNEITQEQFRFFGLEIELWKIGDSSAAPKFNMVSKPNNWSKVIRIGSATQKLQYGFWKDFEALFLKKNFPGSVYTAPRPWYTMEFAMGTSGYLLGTILNIGKGGDGSNCELRVDFLLSSDQSQAQLSWLEEKESELTQLLGQQPVFLEKENVKLRRVSIKTTGDITTKGGRDKALNWLYEKLNQYLDLFKPMISELQKLQSLASDEEKSLPRDE